MKKKTICISIAVLFAIILCSRLVWRSVKNNGEGWQFINSQFLYDDKHKKQRWVMLDGYFDYSFEDIYGGYGDKRRKGAGGKFFYASYMGGDGGSFPYCDWLELENGSRLIELEAFCSYYGYELEADEEKKETRIRLDDDTLILRWNSLYAEYEKTGERINLRYQIIYHKNSDAYYFSYPEQFETFVDVDFLYYAGLLKQSDDVTYNFQLDEKTELKVIISDYYDKTCKELRFFEKGQNGSFFWIGTMQSIAIEMGDYGEGFQSIYSNGDSLVVQQSFGAGKYLVISRIYLKYEKESKIKLVKYTEEHIDRFSSDKDFSEIEYQIVDSTYVDNITSDWVYNMHREGTNKYE